MMLMEGGKVGREKRTRTEKLSLSIIIPHLHFSLQHEVLSQRVGFKTQGISSRQSIQC